MKFIVNCPDTDKRIVLYSRRGVIVGGLGIELVYTRLPEYVSEGLNFNI